MDIRRLIDRIRKLIAALPDNPNPFLTTDHQITTQAYTTDKCFIKTYTYGPVQTVTAINQQTLRTISSREIILN